MAVLRNYNRALDPAARALGADRFKAFGHVTLPIIEPRLIAAIMFVAHLAGRHARQPRRA
jgi:ABC-type spermidine/putrescine transport system permease subunit II